jgi:hypothetical protein
VRRLPSVQLPYHARATGRWVARLLVWSVVYAATVGLLAWFAVHLVGG